MTYEMLTGEKPYTGEHLTTVVYKIVAEDPVAPHRLNPTLSGPIELVLRKAMSKKPEGRYRTCREFTDALEKACAATKGWKTMPRGSSSNEPTALDKPKPAGKLPPARHPLREESVTNERHPRKKGNFVVFLLAMMLLAGIIALVALEYPNWTGHKGLGQDKTESPDVAVDKGAQKTPPTANPDDMKPSPMSPPSGDTAKPQETKPAPDESKKSDSANSQPSPEPSPARKSAQQQSPPAGPQQVQVVSSPGGATAMLDGQRSNSCTTPCSLTASAGHHIVSVSLAGYQVERREIDVYNDPIEMAPIVLRAPHGTLMLSSVPDGAAVTLDGKKLPQTTNTQLQLTRHRNRHRPQRRNSDYAAASGAVAAAFHRHTSTGEVASQRRRSMMVRGS